MKIVWSLLQLVSTAGAFLAFFFLVPWLLDTHPSSNAPPDVLAALPPNCPAYHTGHAKYTCEWRGTIESNPVGLYLNVGAFVACLAFPYFIALMKRGFAKHRGTASDASIGG